jgi:hypothetical protein
MPLTAADKTRASMGGMLGEHGRKGNAVFQPHWEKREWSGSCFLTPPGGI